MAKKPQEEHLHIRIDQNFKDFLQNKAEEEGLTLSAYVKSTLIKATRYKKKPSK